MFSYSKNIVRRSLLTLKGFDARHPKSFGFHRKKIVTSIRGITTEIKSCNVYFSHIQTSKCNSLMRPHSSCSETSKFKLQPEKNMEDFEAIFSYTNFFINPKSMVNNIYNTVGQKTRQNIKPIYEICKISNSLYNCKLTLKWPQNIIIEQRGCSESYAAYKSSVVALILLSKNKYINSMGKPIITNRKNKRKNLSIPDIISTDVFEEFCDTIEDSVDICDLNGSMRCMDNIVKEHLNIMPLPIDRKNKILASKLFPQTLNVLNSFYQQVDQSLNSPTNLLCDYMECNGHWNCTYIVNWPEAMEFNNSGKNKRDARYNCANDILAWLLANGYISKYGRLINPTKPDSKYPVCALTDYYKDMSTIYGSDLEPYFSIVKSSDHWTCTYHLTWPQQVEISQIGKDYLESQKNCAKDVLAWLKRKNYMDEPNKLILNVPQMTLSTNFNNNQRRCYSTTNLPKEDVETAKPSTDSVEIDAETKQFPLPKQILNNMFDVIAKTLNKPEYKVKPEFKIVKQSNVVTWLCIYELKYPEKATFTHTSKNKQDASNKAAIAVLTWLQKKGVIDKHGRPKFVQEEGVKEIEKYKNPPIELSEATRNTMDRIVEEFANFKPHLDFPAATDTANVAVTGKTRVIDQSFRQGGRYKIEEYNKLPISDYRTQIVNEIDKNQIVIIKGEPGCGKSTRVPQYILDHWAKNGGPLGDQCRIVVTQPRRIAAISLAERVAKERHDNVGNIVGYQVRLKSNFNYATGRILYCTTGILLRQLQGDPYLLNYTHIILDEAHERDVNTDLLINLLRNVLEINPKLKLIVMSATLDTQLFQDYYNEPSVVHVPGFTHPVRSYYLDTLKDLDMSVTLENCKTNKPQVVHKEVAQLIKYIHKNLPEGAILCFLPGWNEIVKVQECLASLPNARVLCLHSRLHMTEQWQIFNRSPYGVRKIILSTNIAETSVTIDDVVYVVETGISKEKTYDPKKGVMCLDNQWISQANVNQRVGRAGRVQPGKCYHLYTKKKYDELSKHAEPEILCTSLTKVVLDSKVFSNNMDAVKFFAELPTPPKTESIMRAIEDLRELELLDEKENLTALGRTISEFQLEPKLAKSLVNAVIFKCVTPIVDIVTLFSAETELFADGLRDKQNVLKYKKDFSETSDHLSLMRLFEKWLEYVEEGDSHMAMVFVNANHLNKDKLAMIEKLRSVHFGYLSKGLKDVLQISDDLSDSDELVKGVLLSGVGTILRHRTWDIVKGKVKKGNVLLTRHNHKATITADSVNYKRTKYPTSYLMYINEVVSNLRGTTLVRETSLISPLAVLLFKNGEILLEPLKNQPDKVLLSLSGTKISFTCTAEDGNIIKQTKEALDSIRQYYIYQLTQGGKCDNNLESNWKNILHNLDNILLSNSF